jgi:hypothetical protein
MTYAFTYDVPITAETYARIKESLGPELPPGLSDWSCRHVV